MTINGIILMQKKYFYCVQNCNLECALFVLTNEYIITGSVPLWKYSKMSLTRARLNGLRHQLFRTTISCFYASSKALSIVLIKSVTCSMMSGVIITAWRMRIARSMPWQDVCLSSVRPSARPPHAGIVCKRLHISSKFFCHRVAPPF